MAGGDRTHADGALVAALAGGSTIEDAARRANVGERTVYRRLAAPEFRQQVADARTELIAQTVGRLAEASTEAAATLRRLLNADSESVRLGACRAILELGVKLRESEELEHRIVALERRSSAAASGGR